MATSDARHDPVLAILCSFLRADIERTAADLTELDRLERLTRAGVKVWPVFYRHDWQHVTIDGSDAPRHAPFASPSAGQP